MSKTILITISVLLGIGIIWLLISGNSTQNEGLKANSSNAAVVQQANQQHIKILALGGYTPNQINAVSNKDTVLEFETKGTYDCSSSISIPALSYLINLPPTGKTKVRIPAAEAKDSIEILCLMGMFSATIQFQSI